MAQDMERDVKGRWLENQVLVYAMCSLLVGVTGLLYGVWTNRIEHALARIDVHDQRFNVLESKLALQEYDEKRTQERLLDTEKWKLETEKRIRELEGKTFGAR